MARKRNGRQTPKKQLESNAAEAQLAQQNQLIEQLTQQLNDANQKLEQAETEPQQVLAQALGADESSDRTGQILECVNTLLARYGEVQPQQTTLQRLEDKIDDLRERGLAAPTAIPEAQPAADAAPAKQTQDRQTEPQSSWEQIRTSMLQDAGIEVEPEDQDETPIESLNGLQAPDAIDVDTAGIDDLRLAVERRDAYAVCLLHQMRLIERRKLITAEELTKVADVPEAIKSSIVELEGRLQEVLRMTEIELSMERARVSRDSVRLQAQQIQLSQQEARLQEQRDSMHIAPPSPEKSNRKWLDALGFGKD